MENDISIQTNVNLIDINEYFKLDFPNQNIKGNRKFEEFKQRKLNELGKDAKLFYCKKDSIYFYVSKAECKKLPLYFKKCQLCNNYVCYFCGRNTPNEEDSEKCCVQLVLYYKFFYNGFQYFKGIDNKQTFYRVLIVELIPAFGLMVNITTIYFLLFSQLLLNAQKRNVKIIMSYEHFLKNSDNLFFIFFLYSIVMTICYAIYDIYFKAILLIISLFTKFYPLKYFIGFLTQGLN